mgnify:CR=1 FL=1
MINIKNTNSFSKSNKLYKRALKSIPLATQTFSKSSLQWPLGVSPMFIKKGKGCKIYDIDNNKYIDYLLALMPIILGYGDPDVNNAVKRQMRDGVVFSMSHPIEIKLAEQLIKIIPYAEMVRFGKNGSDALSAAIRLARAYTKKDNILVSGYHGWHDWYIGSTTRDLGVPKVVKNLTKKFIFNDLDSLKKILKKHNYNFAALVIEPDGFVSPNANYLQEVRDLCDKYGIVLIFDEIVCGFRTNLGGAAKEYGVSADLGCFGKALANGYPLSAIVGRREIMDNMNHVFVSGTFSGETLSLAAALATLEKLKKENVPNKLKLLGKRLYKKSNNIINNKGFSNIIKFEGNDWWPRLLVKDTPIENNAFITLLRQQLIANGLFMGSSYNLCLAHTQKDIFNLTINSFTQTLDDMHYILNSDDPKKFIKGSIIKPVFKVR